MRPTTRARVAAALLLAAFVVPAPARAQKPASRVRPRVFALADSTGAPLAVFVVRDSNVYSRLGIESGWLSPTASCMALYGQQVVVQPYIDLEHFLVGWIADSTKHAGAAPAGVVTTLTNDTATIAGVRATRLHITNAGQPAGDMWVARSIVPAKIRAAGDRWRVLLPADYWRWMHGAPGMTEIIYIYGIPLRIKSPDGKTLSASPSDSVPTWVADVERSCAAGAK